MMQVKCTLIALWSIIFLFIGCRQPINVPPNDDPTDTIFEDTSKPSIIWQTAFLDSTDNIPHNNGDWPVTSKELVMFTDRYAGPNEPKKYFAYDKKTGEEVFRFSDPRIVIGPSDLHSKDNNFYITTYYNVFSISYSGNLRWYYKIDEGAYATNSKIIGNYLYYNVTFPNDPSYPDRNYAKLVRIHLETGKIEDIFITHYKEDGYEVHTRSVELWMHPNGDSILNFQNWKVNDMKNDRNADFYAYNLSLDTVLWKIEKLTPSGESNIESPQVKGNSIYIQGDIRIYKIDAFNGTRIWKFYNSDIVGGFLRSNLILKEGLVIANPYSEAIYGIDDATGNLVWEKGGFFSIFKARNPTNMIYHKGYVYFGSGDKLICMRASDGKVIWYEKSPNKLPRNNAKFSSSGIAIDRELGLLFASDGYYVMAVELFEK